MYSIKVLRNSFQKKLLILITMLSIIAVGAFAQATKIMPLGDSITGTPGCWRAYLWNQLHDAGYTNIDFVGTLKYASCSLPYDDDGEGHGSIKAKDIADKNQLPPWLEYAKPDMVLMHLGTNDAMDSSITAPMIIEAYSKMVTQMRVQNPDMIIIVAQIIPVFSATEQCTSCYQKVVDLNKAIPAWAASMNSSRSPIVVVDQWTGFNTKTDTIDGIHPTDAGDKKMAEKWYPAIIPFLSGNQTAPPNPTETPKMLGDVDNNALVNIVDALLIAQQYVGLPVENFDITQADVNGSHSVDIVDALLIAQYYVKLIDSFC
ncbi:MAG: hypothetical protein JXR70_13310 [Spirochaetales bacterium]|nr:hypothetical protein [Spirochaetales bacterium]